MKLKLFIITVVSVLWATTKGAETSLPEPVSMTEICLTDILNGKIEETGATAQFIGNDAGMIVPGNVNFESQTQTRTLSKRQSSHRLSHRCTFHISGQSLDISFIRTYTEHIYLFPSGTRTQSRRLISLGKLII